MLQSKEIEWQIGLKKKQKQEPTICCLQETHFRVKDPHRLKVSGWKKIFHENGNDKKAGVAILSSDKVDLKQRP